MKVKVLGARLLLRPYVGQRVSGSLWLPENEDSTFEVLASGDERFAPGELLILDVHGSGLAQVQDGLYVARPDAVIARASNEGLTAAPGIFLTEEWEDASPSRLKLSEWNFGAAHILSHKYVVSAESGWLLVWRGKRYRAVRESDILAEVESA